MSAMLADIFNLQEKKLKNALTKPWSNGDLTKAKGSFKLNLSTPFVISGEAK